DQVQGQVSDDLAGRGDLHQAPEDRVGRRVQALDLLEAVPESERDGLLPQVGQLPAGDLVLVDAPGRGRKAHFERRVELADGLPVRLHRGQRAEVEPGGAVGEVGRGDDRLERRLAGGAGQRRGGSVDGVDARFDGGDVGAELAARRVVGVQVDGQVEALAEGGDQRPGGGRAQQARHVLDAQDVDARLDELLREPQVVVEGVE